MNRTPPIKYSNTTPVKNPVLGQKLAKNGQIVAKFELYPNQKTTLKNRTPGSNNVDTVSVTINISFIAKNYVIQDRTELRSTSVLLSRISI